MGDCFRLVKTVRSLQLSLLVDLVGQTYPIRGVPLPLSLHGRFREPHTGRSSIRARLQNVLVKFIWIAQGSRC